MTAPFDDLAARLDYPMLIVTAASGDRRAGCLVGFAAQCSIEPSLFMVWLSEKNHTTRVAASADTLVVHLPGPHDVDLAELFGGRTGDEVDKFAECAWHPGPGGAPVLDRCPNWFAGRVLERLPTGDHIGHLLEVTEASAGSWPGQLPFQDARLIDPGHDA